jgi:hypothetical protein
MKKSAKRMILSRETVRNLDAPKLTGVAGGALTGNRSQCQGSCFHTCPNTSCPCLA